MKQDLMPPAIPKTPATQLDKPSPNPPAIQPDKPKPNPPAIQPDKPKIPATQPSKLKPVVTPKVKDKAPNADAEDDFFSSK